MRNHNETAHVNRMIQCLLSPRGIAVAFLFPLLIIVMHLASAATGPAEITFDHSQTGFNLTGAHIHARCASCHVDGVFKGTTHDCANCHVAGNRMGAVAKNTAHIPTFDKCDKCHQTTAWSPAKKFDHSGVAPGSCQNCHNDKGGASGKPSGHIATTASCDTCHKTASWILQGAGGLMPANHLPTGQTCSLCHNPASFIPGVMSHAGIFNNCASCHNGQSFVGVKPVSQASFSGHMATLPSQDCSACHTSTTTFKVANLTTPPAGHLPTTMVCSICHGAGYGPGSGIMSHTGISTGCASCHNGQVFTGTSPKPKPSTHVPTSQPCELCHSSSSTNTGGFLIPPAPANSPTMMNHAGIVSNCAQCHSGTTYAVGVTPKQKSDAPTTHMTTSSDCSACHTSTTSFLVANLTTPPAGHLPTTQVCSTCHSAGYGPGSGVMSHTGISTGCASCHNGQTFTGTSPKPKPSTHVPTSQPCELCHSSSSTNTGGFLIPPAPANSPTMMNHAGIVSNCAQCHSGTTYAVGVTPKQKSDAPTTHMTTSSDCSACHTSTTSFLVANLTTMPAGHLPSTQPCSTCHGTTFTIPGVMNHTGISTGCASCHNGQVFTGVSPKSKPANHLPTSLPCENCHSSSSTSPGGFFTAKMDHTGIVSGCASCHNGQAFYGITPVAKPVGSPGHIPTNLPCEICHSSSKFTNFVIPPSPSAAPSMMNHSGIVSGCATCHGKAGVGIPFYGVTPVFQSSSHIATGTSPCESCHTSTTTFLGATGGTLPANHLPTTQTCTLCHVSPTPYPGVMNHLGISSGCTTCHNGQVFVGVSPVSKPVNHLPTSKPCETCHTTANTSPGGFAGGIMSHTGIVNGCTNCHNGQAFAGITPVSKSSKHIPYATWLTGGSTMQCEFCHSTSVFTSFMTGTVSSTTMHNGTTGGGACYTCHKSPNSWSATNMQTKTHNSTSLSKDCSSSGCHRPLGNTGSSYTKWD